MTDTERSLSCRHHGVECCPYCGCTTTSVERLPNLRGHIYTYHCGTTRHRHSGGQHVSKGTACNG